jgi:hypothetical protein
LGFKLYHAVIDRPPLAVQFEWKGTDMSTLTVRLADSEERDLQWVCKQTGKTKSEVVRELLAESLQAANA